MSNPSNSSIMHQDDLYQLQIFVCPFHQRGYKHNAIEKKDKNGQHTFVMVMRANFIGNAPRRHKPQSIYVPVVAIM